MHWPFLSQEEFELACSSLNQRYIQAKQKSNSLTFKLTHRYIAASGSSYIQIIRLLQPALDVTGLSNALAKLEFFEYGSFECDNNVDYLSEEYDKEALRILDFPPEYSHLPCQPYVIYEIHLHPTYRTPTLWFSLHDLQPGDNSIDIETVYRYLLPHNCYSKFQSFRIPGILSAAPHPVTDLPALFVHPCQTKEAMEKFDCPLEDYLMVWIGIVGGSVGLWLPAEMAQAPEVV